MATRSAHSEAAHDAHGGHGDHGGHGHISVGTYLVVFAALMVLLVLTLVVAAFDLSHINPHLNLLVAMTVAVAKAVLVLVYFMHLKISSQLVRAFAAAGFLWLIIMFGLTMSDYISRMWMPVVHG